MEDSRKRSLVKALSWRLLALAITTTVAWFMFEDVKVAASVGVIDSLAKILVYYFHERFWQRVPFGKRQNNPPMADTASQQQRASSPAE